MFVKRLKMIYPITQNRTSYSIPCLCIGHAPLPNSSDLFSSFEDAHISTAIGFAAHVIHLIANWYDMPIRYPIELCGSQSNIYDNISVSIPNPKLVFLFHLLILYNLLMLFVFFRFPLFMGRGVDKTRVEYGLYLLNLNLQQLLNSQGLDVVGLRSTLSNLSVLVVHITKDL